MLAEECCDLQVGDRVWRHDGESRGTVRYIGPVPEVKPPPRRMPNLVLVETPESGEGAPPPARLSDAGCDDDAPPMWYGIEWDDPVGKHDGTVKGTRYFTCKAPHGSFVLPSKLLAPRFLSTTMESRYRVGYIPESMKRYSTTGIFERDEASAFVNVRNCDCTANLELQSVGRATPHRAMLSSLFPNLTQLSLARTLFCHWHEMDVILDELPKLVSLSLAQNPLGPLPEGFRIVNEEGKPAYRKTHGSITSLQLASTGIDKVGAWAVLATFPALTELTACFNAWEGTMAPPPADNTHLSTDDLRNARQVAMTKLKTLRLDGNRFQSLADVAALFAAPLGLSTGDETDAPKEAALKELGLLKNPIASLSAPDAQTAAVFAGVTILNLKATQLSTWDEFLIPLWEPEATAASGSSGEEENTAADKTVPFRLHGVTELSLMEVPVTQSLTESERRRRLAGLLPPRIKLLNRSSVSESERVAAKRWVLHHYVAVVSSEKKADSNADIEDDDGDIPTIARRMVERDGADIAEIQAATQAFVPQKKFITHELSLRLVTHFTSLEALLVSRSKNFEDVIPSPEDRAVSSAANIKVEVKWSVAELESMITSQYDLPYNRSDVREMEDGWAVAAASWERVRECDGDLSNLTPLLTELKRFYGPKPTISLFHVDLELMTNAGAVRRGMHVRDLLRPSDKIHQLRLQPDDVIICAVIG